MNGIQEVRGSTPLISTKKKAPHLRCFLFVKIRPTRSPVQVASERKKPPFSSSRRKRRATCCRHEARHARSSAGFRLPAFPVLRASPTLKTAETLLALPFWRNYISRRLHRCTHTLLTFLLPFTSHSARRLHRYVLGLVESHGRPSPRIALADCIYSCA